MSNQKQKLNKAAGRVLGAWVSEWVSEFLSGTSAQKGYLVPFKVYTIDQIWK